MNFRFPIIKFSALWVSMGVIGIAVSGYLFFTNINPSVEFTGWVQMQTDVNLTPEQVEQEFAPKLKEIGYENATLKVARENEMTTMLIQANVDNQEQVQKLSTAVQDYIKSKEGKILSQSIIGASVGDFIKSSAQKAIIGWLICIAIYMMFAFAAVRDVISPAILAVIVAFTLLFDIAIPSWAYGFLMATNPTVQLDLVFIAGILTVMGYSINDTIVIFDRVRENMKIHWNSVRTGKMTYAQIFEDSLWQTMRRSLTTSVVTVIMIVCMRFLGTGVIKVFAFIMWVGILGGTFSSIFLSAPLAYLFVRLTKKAL